MNWINMLPWYQWLVLAMVPPFIILLYFLKLRRIPVEVPSTYLWFKTVEDMHVNSIWQRLRKNILLLLQLLAVLMLVLSCLRPGCEGEKLAGDRFIILVDHSASMSATDTVKGISRLDDAKNQIYTLIDRMKPSDAVMVISFSDSESVQQSYTTNKGLLKRKVKAIKQTERGSDMNRALVAASGLANPGRTSDRASQTDVQVADSLAATMYIYSDGAVKEVPKFFLGSLTPEYRPIGGIEPPANVGITAFSINDQQDAGGQVQIFARLQNSSMEDTSVRIALYVEGQLQDARSVNVAGLAATPLNFDLSPLMEGLEQATPIRLEIEDKDVYMQDNVAYCVLNPPRMTNVLVVSDYNTYLELATSTTSVEKMATVSFEDRDFLKTITYQNNATLGIYDLVIFDQCFPETMPTCNTVFFGALPSGDHWKSTIDLETTPITDTNTGHPVMFDVQMGNVNILSGQVLEGPQGSISLIDSIKGSVMMIGPRSGFDDLVVGFPLVEYEDDDVVNNTDWHKNLSFPIFIKNILVTLGSGSRFNAMKTNSPGRLVKVKPQVPYAAIDIKNPEGTTFTVKSGPDNSFVFSQTDKSGIYEVREQGADNVEQMFAVNLLDRLESNLAVRDELNLGYEDVKGSVVFEPARKDFWTWLVLAALVLITIEWFIYNRRVFI